MVGRPAIGKWSSSSFESLPKHVARPAWLNSANIFWIAFLPRTSRNLCYISWAILGSGGQGEFGQVLQVYCGGMYGLHSYFECPHGPQRIGASTTA